MNWKPQPRACSKCGHEKEKDGFSWCKNCREDIEAMIMASTTIKDSDMNIKVGYLSKCVQVCRGLSRLAIRFVIRLAIRMIIKFYRRRQRREEERDVEMLINKAGYWNG